MRRISPRFFVRESATKDEIAEINNDVSVLRTETSATTGNLAMIRENVTGLYINASGVLSVLSADRAERLICVKGKPNTSYVIKKDTVTLMRAGCGPSDAMVSGDTLSSFAGHSTSSSSALYVTTGAQDIYIYVHLFSDGDSEALKSIDANTRSLVIEEDAAEDGNRINMLLVGNSYTLDEFSYVPALLKEAMPDLRFKICALYHGSGSLADQVTHMTGDTAYEKYCEYGYSDSAWYEIDNTIKLSDVINKYPYDVIVFTEASAVTDFANSKPNLKSLIDGYTAMLGHQVAFMWHMSHTRTSVNTYEQKVAMAQDALEQSGICDVFASGTAVENACTTTLDSLGVKSHMRYDTSQHLQEGIPCLVPAYANFLKICELIGQKKVGLYGSAIRPTQEWSEAQDIPQPHGTSVGVSDANCLIAVKCAVAAMKFPFVVTDCSGM